MFIPGKSEKIETMKKKYSLLALALIFMLLATCNKDEEDGPISITYEIRSTGCNDYNYGPWEQECVTIEWPRDDWTLQDFEDQYSGSDIHCASNCCVNFQYRNANAYYGSCP